MCEVIGMKAKLFICLGGAATMFLLAGCQTPLPPGVERGPDGTQAYDVLVDASPPGARIRADGRDMGPTPVHIKIFGDPDGTFHDFGTSWYAVEAFPVTTNQFPQVRYFGTGHLFGPEDHIPSSVYFDMNQPPQQPPQGPAVTGPGPAPYPYVYPYPYPYYPYPYPYYYPYPGFGARIYIGPGGRRWR